MTEDSKRNRITHNGMMSPQHGACSCPSLPSHRPVSVKQVSFPAPLQGSWLDSCKPRTTHLLSSGFLSMNPCVLYMFDTGKCLPTLQGRLAFFTGHGLSYKLNETTIPEYHRQILTEAHTQSQEVVSL